MLANWITLGRLPLLVLNVIILYRGSGAVRLAGVALLLFGMMLDTVDGVIARRTGTTSLFGSVLDIAADRVYEVVLWICFADLGLIPLWIPLVVVARTTLTDAFRSIGVGQGTVPFAQHGTALGRFLVRSTPMRVGYSAAKTTTFCGLALVQALGGFSGDWVSAGVVGVLGSIFQATAWVAVALCLLRGAPVAIHAIRHYWGRSGAAEPASEPLSTR